MGMKFEITSRSGYILVIAEGAYDFTEVRRLIGSAYTAAAEHGLPKILIDCRNMTGTLSAAQRFELGEWVAGHYFQRPTTSHTPVAVVGNEPFIDPARLGENVAANRWVPVKAVTDMQEALKWLGINPDDRT